MKEVRERERYRKKERKREREEKIMERECENVWKKDRKKNSLTSGE